MPPCDETELMIARCDNYDYDYECENENDRLRHIMLLA